MHAELVEWRGGVCVSSAISTHPAKFDELLFNRKRAYDLSLGPKDTERKSARANAALASADPSIKSLMVWNAGRFDPRLLTRFRRLETLTVFCWPDESLAPLAELTGLRELGLDHFPKVRDLSPLGKLSRLRQLELSIAMSASGPQRVRSFAPLGRLKELRIVSAYTMMPEDRDFSPFEQSNRLEYLHLGDWLTLEQRAALVARGIAERGELFQTPINCARCAGFRVYLYGLSSRRKWHCTECDKELIAEQRAAFAALVAAEKERLCVRGAVSRTRRTST